LITAQDAENYAAVVHYEDRELLESGWLVGEENFARRAAVVWQAGTGPGGSSDSGSTPRLNACYLQLLFNALSADGVR
jgi:hypothetical protein